jgi:putative transposase
MEKQVLRRFNSELKRIKDLEAENSKFKRIHAELALENTAIKDVLSRKF